MSTAKTGDDFFQGGRDHNVTTRQESPGDDEAKWDVVSLAEDELEALIDAKVKDRVKALEHKKVKDKVKALERVVMVLLKTVNGAGGQNNNDYSPSVEQALGGPLTDSDESDTSSLEPIMELVDAKISEDGKLGGERSNYFNDDDWYAPFGESIYTLLYLCAVKSQGFWYSILVYCLQVATITLALADSVDIQSEKNPLQIPAMVDQEVTYAQGVTILMLFAYQSDVIEACLKLGDGFHPLEGHPGATFSTWLFSCLAQLAAGLLVLLGCFILTMQASTVIDLMLNLTALLFISEIDDLGFYLAKMGFISNNLQKQTNTVMTIRIKHMRRNIYRRILYFLTMVGLFLGYALLKDKQLNGKFLYTNVYVQFGDAYNPKIPHYSGILVARESRTAAHREYRDIGTSNVLLSYCKSERAWTFSEGTEDPCIGYFAKSYKTTNYDVTSIPDSQWQVLDSNGRLQPFDSFSLVERDCHLNICQGVCQADGLCQCDHDQFGLDCEFSDVCHEIVIDDRFPSFPQVLSPSFADPGRLEFTSFSKKFHRLQNDVTKEFLHIYRMPVFYSNSTFPANIMFFGGRRWIVTNEQALINLSEAKAENPDRWYFPEKTIAVLEDGFHAHYKASYTPFFISDPVDFETPDFQPTPIGLHWWTVKNTNDTLRHFTPDASVDTIMICDDVSSTSSCLDKPESFCGYGDCNNVTGQCDCASESVFYGERCELVKECFEYYPACSGHGTCDEISGLCDCRPPYTGGACWSWHKCYEEDGSCHNGGVCDTGTGLCSCPVDPSISGISCEQVAHCYFVGCANGGICGPNGQCACHPPYYGPNCDLVDKTQEDFVCRGDDDCMDGTCDVVTGLCDCVDPARYGPLCEHTYNCSQTPQGWRTEHVQCLNSGICNETSGVCQCPEPYFGPDCSQVPPCLNDEDCWGPHGPDDGWCDVVSGFCQCTDGKVAGMRCEKEVNECETDDDCYGMESTCFRNACQCECGLGGHKCGTLVVGRYPPTWDRDQLLFEESARLCGLEDPICCLRNDTGFPELKDQKCNSTREREYFDT